MTIGDRLKVGFYAAARVRILNSNLPTLAKPGGNFEYREPQNSPQGAYSPARSNLIVRTYMAIDGEC
jgi:hypothetical protein